MRLSDASTISSSRIASLISSWDIKFDGSNKLSVESFINRIESQVYDTLGSNFQLLCEHIQCLLVGDTKDWYWAYRITVQKIVWRDICKALRLNFGEHRDDTDIIELIKNRKQGPNENFDTYRNNIYRYLERLQHPISETELVKIMEKGLKPRLRQQLMFVEIKTVADLRRFCLKGENLYNELARAAPSIQQYPSNNKLPVRRKIAEVEKENIEQDFTEEEANIDELRRQTENYICWNCRKKGHRYFDCLEARTIVCYGCGESNTYKPQCAKCQSGNAMQSEVTRRQPR